MLEKIYDALVNLFSAGIKVERHEQEIRELRADNRELLDLVRFLAAEVRHISSRQDSDREKIELYIENQILKFERRFPAPKNDEDDGK